MIAHLYTSTSQPHIEKGGINIIGFPFDGTACFRKGATKGPDGIREVFESIESYSPYLNQDLEDHPHFDLGNLDLNNSKTIEDSYLAANKELDELLEGINLKDSATKLITLGGEHSISYAPIKRYLQDYPDLVLLHLDAHADLRDGYLGYHYSHASIIRRSLDHFTSEHKLIQHGIRSGTREEYQEMNSQGYLIPDKKELLQTIKALPNDRPIYLTLDLDFFDPSELPGTGTVEAGGASFHDFISIIKELAQKRFVGADIVELAPAIDPTGRSSVMACKVLRETILALSS